MAIGILERTESVVELNKIETVKTEIQESIAQAMIISDRNITIDQIIQELVRKKIINSGDSNSGTGQVKTQPDGYIFQITEEPDGDWKIEYIGKGDLALPAGQITLSTNTNSLTSSVTITMNAKASSGINTYTLPGGTPQSANGATEITQTIAANQNGTYEFTIVNGNGETVKKSITINNILEGVISISTNKNTPTNQNIIVTVTWPTGSSNGIKEIKVGDGEWYTVTGSTSQITLTKNSVIKAKVSNSVTKVISAELTVNLIDKKDPNIFTPSATSTSNSVRVTGQTTDYAATTDYSSSGIAEYYFKLDGGSWVTNTDKTQTSYTFGGLTKLTSHTYQMKAVDAAGNEVETVTQTISTIDIIGGDDNITISAVPTDWSTSKTVSVTWPSDTTGLTKKISYDGGNNWETYAGEKTITANCVIKARLVDTTNQTGEAAVLTVSTIDTEGPTAPTIAGGSDGTYAASQTITVTTPASDGSGSGVAYYEYVIVSTNTAPTKDTPPTGIVGETDGGSAQLQNNIAKTRTLPDELPWTSIEEVARLRLANVNGSTDDTLRDTYVALVEARIHPYAQIGKIEM